MSWQVYKFGGSSLGGAGRLALVSELVRTALAEGPRLAVVVSALGDSTDWLINAAALAASGEHDSAQRQLDAVEVLALERAREVLPAATLAAFADEAVTLLAPIRRLVEGVSLVKEVSPRSLDEVLSVGERLSSVLVAHALSATGLRALAVDAREFVVTDDTSQNALVDTDETQRLLRALVPTWNEQIPVITGFLGRSKAGLTTTLGRNGSDYTASLVALGLGAKQVTAWTDVPGVFTADPALVAEAYPVTKLTYFEALELAHFGTRMFHARTVVPLLESGATLAIRSTLEPSQPGTRIDALGQTDDAQPTCVTSLENLALLLVESRRSALPSGYAPRALAALEARRIRVWMTNQTGLGVSASFVVPANDAAAAGDALASVEARDVVVSQPRLPVSLVTLVAERMGHQANVAGRFFHALGNVGIKVRAIAQGASERSISCVVDGNETAAAVRTVHAAFNFTHTDIHVLVLGRGTVGGRLLNQIAEQREALQREHGVRLQVVGVADSRGSAFAAQGLELQAQRGPLRGGWSMPQLLGELSRLSLPVLVDCTAADGMAALYRQAFAHGLHVVAANKKPLTLPWAQRHALLAHARRFSRSYLYETTCGASLPIIETLKNLVRTGDVVQRIEGSLSGTLAYLSDAVMQGLPLSVAVANARSKGLTEPHPRDDLSGLDVARKAVILARELGAPIELEDVQIEPFLPSDWLDEPDPDAFVRSLERHDRTFADQVERYRRDGLTLRYLAQVERTAQSVKVKVGPVAVGSTHSAAQLRGQEALVAFTTQRYTDYPLIVRGAGAGGDVTAAGVLADILRLAANVRGRVAG